MEIINAQEQYVPQIGHLFKESFGSNYMSQEQIRDHIRSGVPFKLAVEGPKLVGAILFIPSEEKNISDHVKMDGESIRHICGGKKSLICKCACVYDQYRGQGVAEKILKECMTDIEEQGYGAIFTTLWKYNGTVPARKIFADSQFHKGKELKMPWYHDTKYVCNICKGRCRCDGIVYYKAI